MKKEKKMPSCIRDPLMTVREVTKYLQLTEKTVRNYQRKQLLPFIKLPGGRVRFRREEIDRWIELQGQKGN